ncbi:LamG domain-containing protein, partial [Salibacteraceae bacterium]|nr:LamG domain-containing protein [Salibacteraceae bacterium]
MRSYNLFLLFFFIVYQLSYGQNVPSYAPVSGLVGWYPFEGNAANMNGASNNGVVSNASLSTDRFNTPNSSYSFTGNSNISFGNIDIISSGVSGASTVSIWVYQTQLASAAATQSIIFASGCYGNNDIEYQLHNTEGFKTFYLQPGQSSQYPSYYTPSLNEWVHVVYTQDPSVGTSLYIDGEFYTTFHPYTNSESACNTRIGAYNYCSGACNRPFFGKLDDLGVWNRALDSCEIKNLFQAGIAEDTLAISDCGYSILPDSQLVDSSGSYIVSYVDSEGCDSLVQFDVTIYPEFSDSISIVACDFIISPIGGDTIMSSGIYLDSGISVNGCDSIIVINATIHVSQSTTETVYACEEFTWIDGNTYTSNNNSAQVTFLTVNGCDSVVTLDLTINQSASYTDIQEACNEFTWIDGNTYTSSNNSAQVTLLTVNGCDSVVTLDLTILNADTSVTSLPPSLEANADSATYQWIDCGTSLPIDSATFKLFVAQSNGSYAVVVTQNGCTDTSSCYQIYNVGMESLNGIEASVFPNPSSNEITIQCSGDFDFELLSIDGRTVLSGSGLDAVNCELAEF